MKDEVFGLFPTPILRVPAALDERLVQGLVRHFSARATQGNKESAQLSHTAMLNPDDSPLLVEAAMAITPKVVDMGALMFGQRLDWAIKEMWVNVLETGGMQAQHIHANSFVSGIVYLTPTHAGSQTVFMKSSTGTDFVFRNDGPEVASTPFNAQRWVSPAPAPGDLLLFPSYLLHAVPANQGERRMTMSFNAIPNRLDSWGYRVEFG
ncbi:TIGR02466 family protein [Variovorax sp.]|uniref:TIGR02466 family protein n=1 Tax=Variovorax sp. TaxID=1871043 RepID=UPI002D2B6129|nr:TIGR02466 family protein [Variovorax sp.]HYP85324.1 TIGR02466 family protein [Variovorax sp.]